MKADFTDKEKNVLQGQSGKLASKHNCSQTYVNMIIRGDREIKSELGKNIYNDLLALIDLLSPTNSKDDQTDV